MLYQLGVLSIRVQPFNVDKYQRDGTTDYAAKPVLGAEPPLEYVGEGANTLTLSGSLFPKAIGGLTELEILEAMRTSGTPQYVLRGDGRPMGWYAIQSVSEAGEHLAHDGVARKIGITIKMRRAGKPSRLALFAILLGLFT